MSENAVAVAGEKDSKLVAGSLCLMVSFGRLGIRRKLRDDQYEAGTAEKTLTRADKCILDSPEYKAIVAFEGHVKHYLASKSLPSTLYRASTYLIPASRLKEVDEFLEASKAEWTSKVEEFVAFYPQRKAETMARLGSVAAEGDYKTAEEVRAEFEFEFEYVTMSTPSSLKAISVAMYEREEERLMARLKSAEEEIVAAYRGKFAAAVADMKSILEGSDKDGKPRRFHGWKIPKLREYIESFKKDENVCGDAALVAEMDKASQLLDGVDPKALKSNTEWRSEIAAGFGKIAESLGGMTVARGRRVIDVDDDEAA